MCCAWHFLTGGQGTPFSIQLCFYDSSVFTIKTSCLFYSEADSKEEVPQDEEESEDEDNTEEVIEEGPSEAVAEERSEMQETLEGHHEASTPPTPSGQEMSTPEQDTADVDDEEDPVDVKIEDLTIKDESDEESAYPDTVLNMQFSNLIEHD